MAPGKEKRQKTTSSPEPFGTVPSGNQSTDAVNPTVGDITTPAANDEQNEMEEEKETAVEDKVKKFSNSPAMTGGPKAIAKKQTQKRGQRSASTMTLSMVGQAQAQQSSKRRSTKSLNTAARGQPVADSNQQHQSGAPYNPRKRGKVKEPIKRLNAIRKQALSTKPLKWSKLNSLHAEIKTLIDVGINDLVEQSSPTDASRYKVKLELAKTTKLLLSAKIEKARLEYKNAQLKRKLRECAIEDRRRNKQHRGHCYFGRRNRIDQNGRLQAVSHNQQAFLPFPPTSNTRNAHQGNVAQSTISSQREAFPDNTNNASFRCAQGPSVPSDVLIGTHHSVHSQPYGSISSQPIVISDSSTSSSISHRRQLDQTQFVAAERTLNEHGLALLPTASVTAGNTEAANTFTLGDGGDDTLTSLMLQSNEQLAEECKALVESLEFDEANDFESAREDATSLAESTSATHATAETSSSVMRNNAVINSATMDESDGNVEWTNGSSRSERRYV